MIMFISSIKQKTKKKKKKSFGSHSNSISKSNNLHFNYFRINDTACLEGVQISFFYVCMYVCVYQLFIVLFVISNLSSG